MLLFVQQLQNTSKNSTQKTRYSQQTHVPCKCGEVKKVFFLYKYCAHSIKTLLETCVESTYIFTAEKAEDSRACNVRNPFVSLQCVYIHMHTHANSSALSYTRKIWSKRNTHMINMTLLFWIVKKLPNPTFYPRGHFYNLIEMSIKYNKWNVQYNCNVILLAYTQHKI